MSTEDVLFSNIYHDLVSIEALVHQLPESSPLDLQPSDSDLFSRMTLLSTKYWPKNQAVQVLARIHSLASSSGQ